VPSHGIYPGQYNYFASTGLRFYPKRDIVYMGPQLLLNHTYIPGGTLTDRLYSLSYNLNFISTASLIVSYNYIYSRLTSNFNPIDPVKYNNFLVGEQYTWQTVSATFQSNTRKTINLTTQGTYGGFYNGTKF
jgi:hypothetical protein